MNPREENPPRVLDYPDSLLREALHIERSPNGVRIITAPLRDWKKLTRGFYIAFVILGGIVMIISVATLFARTADDRLVVGLNGGIYGLALVAVVAAAYDRLHRRFGFEVTGGDFTLIRIATNGHVTRWRWHRNMISDVKVSLSGKLRIEIRDKESIELYITPDVSVVQTLANALHDALRTPPSNVSDARHPWPTEAMAHGKSRTSFLVVAGCLSVCGIVLGVFVHPSLCFFPMLLAAIPAGIALGSQEKDYYFF